MTARRTVILFLFLTIDMHYYYYCYYYIYYVHDKLTRWSNGPSVITNAYKSFLSRAEHQQLLIIMLSYRSVKYTVDSLNIVLVVIRVKPMTAIFKDLISVSSVNVFIKTTSN